MGQRERQLARCSGFDVGTERDCIFVMHGAFTGDGWGQGFGYSIDADFVKRFLAVFRKEKLQQVNGLACFIVASNDKIHRVEPLFEKEGEAFDIDAWAAELEAKRKSP